MESFKIQARIRQKAQMKLFVSFAANTEAFRLIAEFGCRQHFGAVKFARKSHVGLNLNYLFLVSTASQMRLLLLAMTVEGTRNLQRHGSVPSSYRQRNDAECMKLREESASLRISAVTFNKCPGVYQLLRIAEPVYTVPGRQEIQPGKRHFCEGENAFRGTARQG
jgi:hypothetical protein